MSRSHNRDLSQVERLESGYGLLWSPWLLGAGGWALHLVASFLLVDWYCHSQVALSNSGLLGILHGLTAFCLLLTLGGGGLALKNLLVLRGATERERESRRYSRSRFLAIGGLIFCAYMSGIVLLEEWGNLVLLPCR